MDRSDFFILSAILLISCTYIFCLIQYLFYKKRIMHDIKTIYPLYDENQKIYTQDKIADNVDLARIIKIDKYFNKTQFLLLVNEYFTKVKHAYSISDLTELSAFESDKLIKKQAKEINNHLKNNEVLKIETLGILFSELYNFYEFEHNYYLVVIVSCRLVEYYSSKDDTEKINTNEQNLLPHNYLLTFKRNADIDYDNETQYKNIMRTSNCPNCGAPTSVITTGTCNSCGKVINLTLSNWILENIEKID